MSHSRKTWVHILRPKVGSLGTGGEKWRTNGEGEGRRDAVCDRQSEKGGKRHASAGKRGAGGMSPTVPSPEMTTSGTQRSLGGRLCQPSAGSRLRALAPSSAGSGGQGGRCRIQPHLPPGHARPAVSSAAFNPYSPGDPGRGTVGARGHLGGRTEGVRGSPRPGGHGGRRPQGGPSRRRPRSRAPRPGPGWGHGGGSALWRGAGRG